MHSEYDERQKLMRAKGNSLGFMVMLIYLFTMYSLTLFGYPIFMHTDTMLKAIVFLIVLITMIKNWKVNHEES